MTGAGKWKWAVPGLALLTGCASLDDGALPDMTPAPVAARPQPDPRLFVVAPATPVKTDKPEEKPAVVQVKGEVSTVPAGQPIPPSATSTPVPPPVPAAQPTPLTPPPPLPPVAESPPQSPPPAPPPAPVPAPAKVVPVSLDAVLRLAEEQNSQVAVARARIQQACAEQDVAAKRILPDVTVGTGYWRHEGGIQLQEGPLIRSSTGATLSGMDVYAKLDARAATFARLDAARKTLQQKGELKRVTTEVMLDAASTYVDLLSAHSGLAIARGLDDELRKLLDRAEKLANIEKGARVEVVRIRAEINGQAQTVRKLEAQAKTAAAKLAYLLGLDSCTELVPVDDQLVAFRLVDATQPPDALVAQAQAHGPGLKELEGILGVIQEGLAEADGPLRWLPVLEARAVEGLFGAGPGGDLTFANRLDMGVQVRWNLTDLCRARAERRVACALLTQAQITHADVRAKLALGVREARETAVSGEQELALATEQILHAKQAADLSDMRLTEGIAGSSFTEVLLSKKAVAGAQASYLGVLREFDKAQLRLMVLCGTR